MMHLVAPYTGAWIEIKVRCRLIYCNCVAPYTGAWIEITAETKINQLIRSHPTRVRGLKFMTTIKQSSYGRVAPYTGAWIEIKLYMERIVTDDVAPYTGAWIEIIHL